MSGWGLQEPWITNHLLQPIVCTACINRCWLTGYCKITLTEQKPMTNRNGPILFPNPINWFWTIYQSVHFTRSLYDICTRGRWLVRWRYFLKQHVSLTISSLCHLFIFQFTISNRTRSSANSRESSHPTSCKHMVQMDKKLCYR